MLRKLLPFELSLQFKQIGFWITLIFVLLASFAFASLGTVTAGERIKINGAFSVGILISILSILSTFFGAVYVVSGVMRDQVSKSFEVIHATPVPTPAMVIARFLGAYLATFVSLIAMVVGVFVAHLMPWVEAEALGPVTPWYYIQPTIVFVAVNALLVTSIFTMIATATRDRTLVYVSAVGLFMLYIGSGFLVNDSTPDLIVALSDPFGATAFAEAAEFWPAAEQNTRTAPLDGYVGLNRLVWGGLALCLFAYSFLGFKRGVFAGKKTNRGAAIASNIQDEIKLHDLTAPLSTSSLLPVWTRTKFEYLATIRSIPFIIFAGLVLGLTALFITVGIMFNPDPTLPTNSAIANLALAGTALPLLLVAVFFAGEIVWRDRVVKMTELVDATPTRNWPFMAGKWLAMLATVFTVVTLGIFLGIASQLFLGDVDINLATHFSNGYLGFMPRMLLFAALVMFIQNFMPNRVVGMIVGGVVVMGFLFGVGLLPFYHPLMGFARTPTGGFSEMNGFGDFNTYLWFLTYWTGLAGLFAVGSMWLWRRGLQTSLLRRLQYLRSQISPLTSVFAAVSAFAFIGAGWTIYQGYNVKNDYQTRNQLEAQLTTLENELGDSLYDQLPRIQDVATHVEFYPAEQTVDVTGEYLVRNTTDAPLADIYISTSAPMDGIKTLTLTGATQSLETEPERRHNKDGIRLYKFSEPVAPGEEFTVAFDIDFPAPTLGGSQLVRNNGTFLNNQQLMPTLGLIDFRITNPDRRRKNGLPELKPLADRTDMTGRRTHFLDRASDYVNFKATVCTDASQIPVAPGTIIDETITGDRICRTYKPNEPIVNFFAFVSADYEVAEDTWTGPAGQTVELSILYDAQHDYNIELMIKAMKDSLDVFTETFGPYQYDTMRIMEFPYASFAQSFAGTIPFSENIGFVREPGEPDDNESVDLATYVTMHEIGHQWFGHQIIPAEVRGFNVLSEGLTENAALTAYEATYGWQKARRTLDQRAIQDYLVQRTLEAGKEQPLALARGDQQYLVYNKASWVFWGLKQYIGEDNMQSAVRGFLEEFGQKGAPYPTTLELVGYLRAAAGEDYDQLVTDYWDRITFWDLKFGETDASVKPAGSGFEVSLTLALDKKIASEETGKEASVTEAAYADPEEGSEDEKGDLLREAEALNEWVEIGFYIENPADTFGDEWLQLERVRLSEMENELTFTLEERPNYIVLDPRRLLIERNVGDNTFRLPESDDS